MRLPLELAMEVGSYLSNRELTTCTAELCSSAAAVEFVAIPLSRRLKKVQVNLINLIDTPNPSLINASEKANAASLAQRRAVEQIDLYLSRHKCRHVEVVVLYAIFRNSYIRDMFDYANFGKDLQSLWHATDGGRDRYVIQWSVNSWCVPTRDYLPPLHTLAVYGGPCNLSNLASQSLLHTLELSCCGTLTDVSPLTACQSLDTLKLSDTSVTDVSSLALCRSLRVLDLSKTQVTDVSALARCPALQKLILSKTQVTDVSALAACPSLHTLDLSNSNVTDVSTLAACPSLHTLDLSNSNVTDVSALAACPSLHLLYDS